MCHFLRRGVLFRKILGCALISSRPLRTRVPDVPFTPNRPAKICQMFKTGKSAKILTSALQIIFDAMSSVLKFPFSIIDSKYMKTKWIFCGFSNSVLPRQCRASSGTQIIAEKPHPSKYCDLLSHSSDQISLTFAYNLYARFRLAHLPLSFA